ncbi:MAG: 23S rRNA (pseudouridine(1915)-N(3))-methyltransferase RlmH [Methylococcales bacterium]|nr:23S rRNA (pseudouridine(1915)-N(3))-methyltransferase RlmH [Methylococcales bacterium]MBT7442577.1 23S rRNA (pseudouridine(1915)-N(3))-methyltransferase RlmH [Methylococcales bacterium]
MRIKILSVGKKMPSWIAEGVATYIKRFQGIEVKLVDIVPPPQSANRKKQEGVMILEKVDAQDWVVALDEKGKQWSTQQVAKELEGWTFQGQNVTLIIGGADGLSDEVRTRANQIWSLSLMTMPHMLVRVVLVEQLYRAWSLLKGHPYHRE